MRLAAALLLILATPLLAAEEPVTKIDTGRISGAGAAHGFEIPYVFGNLYPWLGLLEADERLSRVMQDARIRFARTGDPNGEGLPMWLPHTAQNDAHVEFSDEPKTGTGLPKKECDLIDEISAARN